MSRALAPVFVLSLVMVGIQLSILSSLRAAGVVVMVVWLWPLCVGLTGATGLAVMAAVVSGVFFDTHSTTPFGLSALVGVGLALAAARLGREGVGDLDSAALWVAPSAGALGGFVAPLAFAIGGCFYWNFSLWDGSVLTSMVVNALAFFVLTRPLTRLAQIAAGRRARVRR